MRPSDRRRYSGIGVRALVEQHAVRECLVAKIDGGLAWGLSIRLGSGARWLPLRLRRELRPASLSGWLIQLLVLPL